jgi:hypothetical protein
VSAASFAPSIIAVPNEVFNFTGACTDCFSGEGNATATLTLTGNYTLGSAITGTNFVSFAYTGTDLLSAFTISDSDTNLSVSGSMTTIPGFNSLDVQSNNGIFDSQTVGGFWCAGSGCLSDFGTAGTFSQASVGTPEPATFGLLGLGLAGFALLGRRRSSKKK